MSINFLVAMIEFGAQVGYLAPIYLARALAILSGPDAHHLLTRLSEAALAFLGV